MNIPRGMAMLRPKPTVRTLAVTAGVAAAGGLVLARSNSKSGTTSRFLLPRPVSDAICGAVGEVAQIIALYPLETIKVRCQAESISTREVLSQLFKSAGKAGSPSILAQLYSGFGAAALFSVAVGAVHWLSFCATKRAALVNLTLAAEADRSRATSGATASTSSSATADGKGRQAHRRRGKQAAKPAEGDAAAAGAAQAAGGAAGEAALHSEQQHHHPPHVSSAHHAHNEKLKGTPADQDTLKIKTTANMIAALVGAFATALIESPVELFRHQAQAGMISGNLVKEMASSVRRQGPLALWYGFLPFCCEAFPYDISELATYSQLRDVYDECTKPTHRFSGLANKLQPHVWDLIVGGAAGAVAVAVSMPFDCIKTYMQTHVTGAAGKGFAGQVGIFFQTGAQMVARKGPGALFVGLAPRLVQQVPSATICWWTVERCQQLLKEHTQPSGSDSEER